MRKTFLLYKRMAKCFGELWHELNQVVVCQLFEHLRGSQIRSFYLDFIMLEEFEIYFQKINVKSIELGNIFKSSIFYLALKKIVLARFVKNLDLLNIFAGRISSIFCCFNLTNPLCSLYVFLSSQKSC